MFSNTSVFSICETNTVALFFLESEAFVAEVDAPSRLRLVSSDCRFTILASSCVQVQRLAFS